MNMKLPRTLLRQLVLVLAAKHIRFTVRREANDYYIDFSPTFLLTVRSALGI